MEEEYFVSDEETERDDYFQEMHYREMYEYFKDKENAEKE